jgi:hypothetical protein
MTICVGESHHAGFLSPPKEPEFELNVRLNNWTYSYALLIN